MGIGLGILALVFAQVPGRTMAYRPMQLEEPLFYLLLPPSVFQSLGSDDVFVYDGLRILGNYQ